MTLEEEARELRRAFYGDDERLPWSKEAAPVQDIWIRVARRARGVVRNGDASWTVEEYDGGYRVGIGGIYEAVQVEPYQIECTLNSLQRRVAGGEKP